MHDQCSRAFEQKKKSQRGERGIVNGKFHSFEAWETVKKNAERVGLDVYRISVTAHGFGFNTCTRRRDFVCAKKKKHNKLTRSRINMCVALVLSVNSGWLELAPQRERRRAISAATWLTGQHETAPTIITCCARSFNWGKHPPPPRSFNQPQSVVNLFLFAANCCNLSLPPTFFRTHENVLFL